MAITINGSGTVTGISVGGIPDGVVDTDVLAANAVTFGKIGTTEQGQLCKAWVNFNGTGAVAIRASYNVSSITDNGTGDYTVNFTTALADANYCAVATANYNAGGNASIRSNIYSTTAVEIITHYGTAVKEDSTIVNLAIFR